MSTEKDDFDLYDELTFLGQLKASLEVGAFRAIEAVETTADCSEHIAENEIYIYPTNTETVRAIKLTVEPLSEEDLAQTTREDQYQYVEMFIMRVHGVWNTEPIRVPRELGQDREKIVAWAEVNKAKEGVVGYQVYCFMEDDDDDEEDPPRACDCETPSSHCYSGVPGILTIMATDGKVLIDNSVERCDGCERFATDDAAIIEMDRLDMFYSNDPRFGVSAKRG